MMRKSSLSNFCLTNVRNLKVFLEVHGRDIDFAKSEQSYHLTSTDAEAAAVTLLLPLHRRRYISESYSIVCKGAQWLSGRVLDSRPKGSGFEPHRRHCVVVLEQDTFILA